MGTFLYYRTEDGGADYGFSFEIQSNGTWRVYIESQPSYRGRATDAHSTHRLSDNGSMFICWDRPISTYKAAKNIAALWANKTQEYIRTGRRF